MILPVLIVLMSQQQLIVAKERTCVIKYGKKNLQQKSIPVPFGPMRSYCYQIGVEFDRFGDSIPEKPIFACCRSNIFK